MDLKDLRRQAEEGRLQTYDQMVEAVLALDDDRTLNPAQERAYRQFTSQGYGFYSNSQHDGYPEYRKVFLKLGIDALFVEPAYDMGGDVWSEACAILVRDLTEERAKVISREVFFEGQRALGHLGALTDAQREAYAQYHEQEFSFYRNVDTSGIYGISIYKRVLERLGIESLFIDQTFDGNDRPLKDYVAVLIKDLTLMKRKEIDREVYQELKKLDDKTSPENNS